MYFSTDPNYDEAAAARQRYGTDEFPLTLEPRLVRGDGFAVTVDREDVIRPSSVQTEYSTFTYLVTSVRPDGNTLVETDIVVSSNIVTSTPDSGLSGGVEATPSLPLLSPHETVEESHSNMTTPSLPSLSPALRHSPSLSPALPLPRRPDGILPRRPPTQAMLDPAVSSPLSVLIPAANQLNSYKSSQSNLDSSSAVAATPKRKSRGKVSESPVERSATGRRMRDCRKFIHYEFSPPFASSESSVGELESPEMRQDNLMKRLTKKKGRPIRTQSMTEECLSSPNSLSSNQSVGSKKRGRPTKSKSTDCKEEVLLLDEESNGSELGEEKKRKRGRPPKKRPSQDDDSKISVSDFADNLTESQISPITREKQVFPLSSPNTEEKKARLISQQRESLMLRRNSDDSKKARKTKKSSRSKSMDASSNLESVASLEDLEVLKAKLSSLDRTEVAGGTISNTTPSPPPPIVQQSNSPDELKVEKLEIPILIVPI